MERPNDNIWYNVVNMRLLKELDLTEQKTFDALMYLFPDIYENHEKECWEQVSVIKNKFEVYGKVFKDNWEFLKRDMENLKNELIRGGIIDEDLQTTQGRLDA